MKHYIILATLIISTSSFAQLNSGAVLEILTEKIIAELAANEARYNENLKRHDSAIEEAKNLLDTQKITVQEYEVLARKHLNFLKTDLETTRLESRRILSEAMLELKKIEEKSMEESHDLREYSQQLYEQTLKRIKKRIEKISASARVQNPKMPQAT